MLSSLQAVANALAPRNGLHKTGYISDRLFLQHHIAAAHPESPDRIRFVNQAIKQSKHWQRLIALPLKARIDEWLRAIHTESHIASVKHNTPIAHTVASGAVGACLNGIDQIAKQKIDNAFCATRPPGHHALNTGREEGFCYYNSIAIAARYAQRVHGFKKILIVDWDYHHGNATEHFFYDDPSVLFFSTHDQFAYPGTGDPSKTGAGAGLGYNINVHLPCGTNDEAIIAVFNKVLVPAAAMFKPDLVLISAGFDSRRDDRLGCFDISDAGFAALTRIVMQIAAEYCDGRLLSLLEGGYNLQGNATAAVAHVATLLGERV